MGYILAYLVLKAASFIGLVVGGWHLMHSLKTWEQKTITKKED
jgi:hypothetical protein